jgi:predicted negative regulator of RcsB-dependent stress response
MSALQKKADDLPDPIPSSVPEDLIPAWLWFKENGTQWLVTIAVAILLAVGVSVFLRNRAGQAAKASEQLLAQPTVETLEKTVADYGSTPAGAAAQLKLAKAYCDSGRYAEALSKYDEFIKAHASYPFADVARVGRGFALCGLNQTDEAIAVFRSFREKNPGHYLAQQATFGEAACLALQGKKDAAKNLLQELRAANRETPWETAAKRMEGAIDRYQARPAHTLLEQANALAPISATPAAAVVTNTVR